MKEDELHKPIRLLCVEALYSSHQMKKEQEVLVYGYAQKQIRRKIRQSSIIKRIQLRYLRALG